MCVLGPYAYATAVYLASNFQQSNDAHDYDPDAVTPRAENYTLTQKQTTILNVPVSSVNYHVGRGMLTLIGFQSFTVSNLYRTFGQKLGKDLLTLTSHYFFEMTNV